MKTLIVVGFLLWALAVVVIDVSVVAGSVSAGVGSLLLLLVATVGRRGGRVV